MKSSRVFRFSLARTAGLVALSSIACLTQAQTITTFDMPNSTFTQPAAINAAGQITGSYGAATYPQHGFLRQPDGTVISFDAPYPFPTAGPPVQTAGTSINESGEITGYVYHSTDQSYGFLRQTDGTLLVFGAGPSGGSDCLNTAEDSFKALTVPTTLFLLEGTVPAGINNRGQIAGVCDANSGSPDAAVPVAFLRDRNGSILKFQIPTTGVGNPWTRALAVNARGQITGDYCCTPPRDRHGFLRDRDGTITTFDATSLGGQSTTPTAINSKGQITGYADHGFLREPNGTIVTFDAPLSASTQPTAINSRGDITGTYSDMSGLYHGFVRERDGTITTVNIHNAINTYPTSINAEGDITGWYQDAGGIHGFLRSHKGLADRLRSPRDNVGQGKALNETTN